MNRVVKCSVKDVVSQSFRKIHIFLYIIAFYALIIGRVSAQNADTLIFQSYSVRTVGFGFPALRYDLLSPLNHSGYSLAFTSTRYREKPEKHLNQFKTHFELGVLYNYANDSYITLLGFDVSWSRHWYINDKTHPLRLMAGFSTDIGANAFLKDENTNNPLAYFFNLSISPGIIAKYPFKIKGTNINFFQQIDIPLVSLISTSDYSSTIPPGFLENELHFFDAMRIASLGSLIKCMTITTLDVNTSWQRRKRLPDVRINYIFSGMTYKNSDFAIKSANHMVVFGAIFHLFR